MQLTNTLNDPRAIRAELQDRQAAHQPAVAHLLTVAAKAIRPSGPAPKVSEGERA